MHKVQLQYAMSEQTEKEPRKLVRIDTIRELSLGAPPAAANQYATATTFIAMSRYCEGRAQLDPEGSEVVYWRIDQAKDGTEEYMRTDHCSKRHDVFADECKWWRPGG
jgi:hypothetical protein